MPRTSLTWVGSYILKQAQFVEMAGLLDFSGIVLSK
jgi:hypothetical protein